MKKIIVLLIIFLLAFNGCEKDNNPTDQDVQKTFKLNFINNRIRGNGWVVLNTPDGKGVKAYKSFHGNSVVDFGDIQSDRATFSYIDSYTDENGWKYVIIASDIDAPAGEWTLNGSGYAYKGKVNATVNYPSASYGNRCLGVERNTTYGYSTAPGTSFSQLTDIFYLNPDNRITLFSSVIRSDVDSALCGWVQDTDFTPNITNYYSFALDTKMSMKRISTNRPFNRYFLSTLEGDSVYVTGMSSYANSGNSTTTEFPVYYYPGFPHNYYYLNFYSDDNIKSEGYLVKLTDFPSNVNIPTLLVEHKYNADSLRFENIVTYGTFDQYAANWIYSSYSEKITITWVVYARNSVTSVTRPVIPQEILSQMPWFNIGLLRANYLSVQDYDVTSSMDDIIGLFFKSNDVPLKLYSVYHYCRKTVQ